MAADDPKLPDKPPAGLSGAAPAEKQPIPSAQRRPAPRRPDFPTFLAVVGIAGTLFAALFLANVMELNWWISAVLDAVFSATLVGSLLRHAIPHVLRRWQIVGAVAFGVSLLCVRIVGTVKQYSREHPPIVII